MDWEGDVPSTLILQKEGQKATFRPSKLITVPVFLSFVSVPEIADFRCHLLFRLRFVRALTQDT